MEYIVDNEELLKKRVFDKERLAKYVEQEMMNKYDLSEADTAKFKKAHEYIAEFARRFYFIIIRLYNLAYYSKLSRKERQRQADSIVAAHELDRITLMSFLQFEDIEKKELLRVELEFAQNSYSKDKYRETLSAALAEINGIIYARVLYLMRQEIPQDAEKNIDCTLASMMGDMCKDMMGEYLFSLILLAFKNYVGNYKPLDSFSNRIVQLEDINDMTGQIFLANCILSIGTQIDVVSSRVVEHMYRKE